MSTVYFVRSECGLVKIGFTTQPPWVRYKQVRNQVESPTELAGYVEGGRDLELALHAEFEDHREFGEWFRIPEHGWARIRALDGFRLGKDLASAPDSKKFRGGKQQITAYIPCDVAERFRNAVYWLSGPPYLLGVSSVFEEALRSYIDALEEECNDGRPFPDRSSSMKSGRKPSYGRG